MESIKVLGIIPARYESSRFPGKPLAHILGKPMIQWVYEGCKHAFSELIVATDDRRISDAVEAFGGKAILTSSTHKSGTERCAEVLFKLNEESDSPNYDYVVNIQGDEPLMNDKVLQELFVCLQREKPDLATLVCPLLKVDEFENPNTVKVVCDKDQYALYFSRYPIPFQKDKGSVTKLKHIGIYAYRSNILSEIANLNSTPMSESESLEQLRWMEHGYRILTCKTDYEAIGVDSPEDIAKVETCLRKN